MTCSACARGRDEKADAHEHVNAGRHHGRGMDQAETGVGPSIASGNQTCSGNCAILPTAPQKMQQRRDGQIARMTR